LAIRIGEFFEYRPDWYRQEAVAPWVLEYYGLLRSVLRAKPHLRACLTRCRHCRIFFLTHPRNAGRRDLGCPFGCSETHRKRESTKRSVAYYRGEQGKKYRREQNGNRQRTGMRPAADRAPIPSSPSEPPNSPPAPDSPADSPRASLPPPESDPSAVSEAPPPSAGSPATDPVCPWPVPLVAHVRMVVSLIEGRPVNGRQIRQMLAQVLRQHSIGQRRPLDHIVAWLHKEPP